MNLDPDRERDLRVVVLKDDASDALEERIRIPEDAEFSDLIDALRAGSPDIYEAVRRRVLRAAGRVLAFGRDDPLLVAIDDKLAHGGTLIFPAEEDGIPADGSRIDREGAAT